VTFLKNVYVTSGRFTSAAASATHPRFRDLTRLLLHEIQHVKQYRDMNYDLNAFALKYNFQICKAGFDSSHPEKLPLEKEAYDIEVRRQIFARSVLIRL
jgi:hypothetical protein